MHLLNTLYYQLLHMNIKSSSAVLKKVPTRQVWVAPRQWSWPINLPLEFFGIFRARALEDEDDSTPWADEIEQKVFSSPEVGKAPPFLATSRSNIPFQLMCHFVFYFLRKYVD